MFYCCPYTNIIARSFIDSYPILSKHSSPKIRKVFGILSVFIYRPKHDIYNCLSRMV